MTPIAAPNTVAARGDAAAREAAPAPALDEATRTRAEKAAVQFEGYMIAEMLKQARSGLRELSHDEGRRRTHDEMQDVADRAVADSLAASRAFSIADAVLRQVLPPEASAALKPAAAAVAQGSGEGAPSRGPQQDIR
jgi:flagellar protein FlgJ